MNQRNSTCRLLQFLVASDGPPTFTNEILFGALFSEFESDFHEVADEFINLANELSEDWAMPFLSAVFMYAAARYSAHFFH